MASETVTDTSAEYAFEEAYGYGYDPEVSLLDRTAYARARRRAEHEDAPITFRWADPAEAEKLAKLNEGATLSPAAREFCDWLNRDMDAIRAGVSAQAQCAA